MSDSISINGKTIRLLKGDVTDLEVEAFVYYARHDLALGSGFGNAISMRGGPSVQEELKQYGPLKTTEAIISSAGEMKANYIIHAVGPRFQEENLEDKLRATVLNCLKLADDKGIRQIAFPSMGTGFYGIPLDVSAEVTLTAVQEYLANETGLDEIIISPLDNREYGPFQNRLSSLTT
jgi:O-acetyl-ADP-ribose deacetylase (regulator of RNase III)